MLKYVLFDLDGTLTESGPGIMQGVRYALEKRKIPVPGEEILSQFVGPPLYLSFMRHFGMTEQEAKDIVPVYKEFYDHEGVLINRPYPGVPEMLKDLQDAGLQLAVASAKPHALMEKVLDHFALKSYFTVAQGARDTGTPDTKRQSILEALTCLSVPMEEMDGMPGKEGGTWPRCLTEEILMVGDRRDDVEGADAFGIRTVAVRWGYAPAGELEDTDAVAIVDTAAELTAYLLRARQS